MASYDSLNIDTPENVIFGYEVAGIGSRFLAALIDSIIIAALIGIAYFTLALITGILGGLDDALLAWIIALFGLLAFVILWGYYILFEIIWNGQSPGKRWQRLRVLRTDGTPITGLDSVPLETWRVVSTVLSPSGFLAVSK